ncbi:4-hydroxybenzoate polyprenyltransferase [Epilithonimonas bovis DSM 19482]|uniref:4-hydroxybenzoate polyprenyltransferase n=1 Tax=Epilithonimonas bovis DSM 19482 TaxID=1121284 RepID=A0A1U7PVR0_9FLAO|nr:UbiA family prenyltransferase [Epilithonimonas bovis]SIT96063.1 4-hydroxybenzoate polyprenyltransferase [Epilithonimonas bovis DSM 19482]
MANEKKPASRNALYRISQLMGFLLGARFFVAVLLTFALYVSTFFLFNREESFRNFVFDYKVHFIIICSVLSILAGGIINRFYDKEKDQLIKPFRSRLQNFLKEKYFLTAYVLLNTISLGLAFFVSHRVFIFFLVYQFLMWFYSHKLSRIMVVNNMTFVALTLYPFFGMLIYYQTFSLKILFLAVFLFLMLFIIDVIKDTLTRNADKMFGYGTIANHFGFSNTRSVLLILLIITWGVSVILSIGIGFRNIMAWYFLLTTAAIGGTVFMLYRNQKNDKFKSLNLLRLWIFVGILAMLLDGIYHKYPWLI